MNGNFFLNGDLNSLSSILHGLLRRVSKKELRWRDCKIGHCGFSYEPGYVKMVADWLKDKIMSIAGKEIRCEMMNYYLAHVFALETSVAIIEILSLDEKTNNDLKEMARMSLEFDKRLTYYGRISSEKKKLTEAHGIETIGELKAFLKKIKGIDEDYFLSIDYFKLPNEARLLSMINAEKDKVVFYRKTGHYGVGEEIIEVPVLWLYVIS
jgi:hypothetical protein